MYEQFLAISFALIVSIKATHCQEGVYEDCEYATQFDDEIYTYEQTPKP